MNNRELRIKLIKLNQYLKQDLVEAKESKLLWKERLLEVGDVLIAPHIDQNRTYGSMHSDSVERIERLQREIAENEELINELKIKNREE